MNENVNDEELYSRYKKGDSDAYDELMNRHGDALLWYLYGILHDYQDAEDMMIEAFARIMVKKPWIPDKCFKSYIFKTGRNLAIRHAKRSSRVELFSLDGADDVIPPDESAENTAVKNEKTEILQRCLNRIDPDLREALYLVYVDGLSYGQAADVLKVNIKKIDHMLQKGKTRMKEELKKEGVEEP